MSDQEYAAALEAGGNALMRIGDAENAKVLYAAALEVLYRKRRSYRCDPDESAGLAEVVELRQWSRKVPCE